jgi:hypothetical protein
MARPLKTGGEVLPFFFVRQVGGREQRKKVGKNCARALCVPVCVGALLVNALALSLT